MKNVKCTQKEEYLKNNTCILMHTVYSLPLSTLYIYTVPGMVAPYAYLFKSSTVNH